MYCFAIHRPTTKLMKNKSYHAFSSRTEGRATSHTRSNKESSRWRTVIDGRGRGRNTEVKADGIVEGMSKNLRTAYNASQMTKI